MWKQFKISFNLLLIVICLNIGFSKAATLTKKQRVCVIGAGAAGLISAKHLADHPDEFDIMVFEQNSYSGGVWVYSDNTDVDERGLPVNNNIYKSLRTNAPKTIITIPRYKNISDPEGRSSIKHEVVLSYLKNYTDDFDLHKHIEFNTLVEKVTPIRGDGDWRSTKFLIKKRNLITNDSCEITCDAVMVCNGHYYEPNIPKISGIETFPGKVIHSRIYRKPEVYNGQTVAILGASASGTDIATDLAKHAKKVYLSHNKPKIEGSPDNVMQVAGVVGANGNKLLLKDNSTITADAFILCTGYHFAFPFLDEDSGIKVARNKVTPLYKHLINIEHPKMSLLGLPLLVVYFPLMDFQAKFFVALLQEKVKLPNKSDMLLDSTKSLIMGIDQWPYATNLAEMGGFEPPEPWYEKADKVWKPAVTADLWHFKENNLVLKEDGNYIITKA